MLKSENFLQQKHAVWSKNCFSNFFYILSFTWVRVGFVRAPDISLQLGYCLDIILLLSLVSDANINVYLSLFNLLFFHFFYWHNTYIIISNLMKEHVLHG